MSNLVMTSPRDAAAYARVRRMVSRGTTLTDEQMEQRRDSAVASPNASGTVTVELFAEGRKQRASGALLEVVGFSIDNNGIIGLDLIDRKARATGSLTIACPELSVMLATINAKEITNAEPVE